MVDMVFLVFIGFLYPPPAWEVFLLGQKSSPKDFLSVVVVYAFFFSALFLFKISFPLLSLSFFFSGPRNKEWMIREGASEEGNLVGFPLGGRFRY